MRSVATPVLDSVGPMSFAAVPEARVIPSASTVRSPPTLVVIPAPSFDPAAPGGRAFVIFGKTDGAKVTAGAPGTVWDISDRTRPVEVVAPPSGKTWDLTVTVPVEECADETTLTQVADLVFSGDTVSGTIVHQQVRQRTEVGTTTLRWNKDGSPQMQLEITLQTQLRGWQGVKSVPTGPPGPQGQPGQPQQPRGRGLGDHATGRDRPMST